MGVILGETMANDREVLREIWDGKLPICFQLDQEEIMEIQQPDPFYVMVPRLSYFPLVTDKVGISWTISLFLAYLRTFLFIAL